MEIHSSFFSWQ